MRNVMVLGMMSMVVVSVIRDQLTGDDAFRDYDHARAYSPARKRVWFAAFAPVTQKHARTLVERTRVFSAIMITARKSII